MVQFFIVKERYWEIMQKKGERSRVIETTYFDPAIVFLSTHCPSSPRKSTAVNHLDMVAKAKPSEYGIFECSA